MKIKNFLALIVTAMVIGCHRDAFAQATAKGDVSASVIVPISMVKNLDMSFGSAAVSATTGGIIILTPAGSRSTAGGGVTLPAISGYVSAACFTVSGAPGFSYSISLPSSAIINGPGTASMTVSGFTSSPSAAGALNTGGAQVFSVGATLNVAAAQADGVYTNATAIAVTVNYN